MSTIPYALNTAPPNFSELLCSDTFEIIAGQNKTCFTIHSSTLAGLPKPLRSMTTAAWKTPETRKKMDLSSWSSDIVKLFIEFLYFKNYNVIDLREDKKGDGMGEMGRDGGDAAQGLADSQELEGADEVNADVLLVHLRVYALAQHEGFEELKRVALGLIRSAVGGEIMLGSSEELKVAEVMAEKLTGMEKDLHDWKSRAAASDEKLRQTEIAYAERVRELEATITKMETTYSESIQQLNVVNTRKEQELTQKIEMRLCDAEKELCDIGEEVHTCKNQAVTLEDATTEKLREFEFANVDKLQQLDANTRKIEVLETKVQLLESQTKWMKRTNDILCWGMDYPHKDPFPIS